MAAPALLPEGPTASAPRRYRGDGRPWFVRAASELGMGKVMHKDTAALRWTLGPLGLVAVGILAVVSAVMNYRFGYSLGKTHADGQIYALAAVGADILKMASPFFFFSALAARSWGVSLAALIVWVVTTAFALTGALGHAALNRLDTAGQRALASTVYKDHRADLKRYQDALSWLPPHRATAAVKADLEGLKSQRLWTATSECQETAGKAARQFCAGYHKLDAELGNALEAAKLNAKIEEVSTKLAGTRGEAVMSEADPQAAVISRMTGWDLAAATSALIYLIVALLETGSGLGPYVVLRYMAGRPSKIVDIIPQESLETDPPPAATSLPPIEPPKLLEAPTEPAVAVPAEAVAQAEERILPSQLKRPPRQPWRQAISLEARAALDEIDFPQAWRSGPLRPKLPPKPAAARFATWLKATGLHGQHGAVDLGNHYLDFCEQDHREPTGYNQMASMLEARGNGINRTRPIVDGKPTTVYVVAAGKFKARAAKPLDAERLGPLTPSKQAEHEADRAQLVEIAKQEGPAAASRRPFSCGAAAGVPPTARRQPDGFDLAWLWEQRKRARAVRIATNRRQRRAAERRVA